MEFWPKDFRTDIIPAPTKKKRKGKQIYVAEESVELGTLGAATLTSERGVLEWITLARPRSRNVPRVINKALEIFPPTKPPPVTIPRLTVDQRAEHGARFLRTYHPDVDVPFELIKNELLSDNRAAAAHSALNPYSGNRLAHLSMETKKKHPINCLAFVFGETSLDLNVSPFRVTRDMTIFTPSATPAMSFNTPIQQLATFSSSSGVNNKFSLLAVRTHSVVSIVKLQGSTAFHVEGPSIVASAAAHIPTAETGNRRIVDVDCSLFSPSSAQAVLVNTLGAVYNYRVEREHMTLVIAPNASASEDAEGDQFWRVVRKDVDTGFRASGRTVQLFDLRAGVLPSLELLRFRGGTEYVTSIEAPCEGQHTMCFATTKKLVWFDERNFKSPILALDHQRALDRTLRAETVILGSSPLATLSSTANRLMTFYDVNYGPSGHIHLHGEPSVLTSPPSLHLPITGSIFFRHPAEEGPDFTIFQLSSRGSLWKTDIAFPSDVTDEPMQLPSVEGDAFEWADDVQALAQKAKNMTEIVGGFGGREYFEANLREAYEEIFQLGRDGVEIPDEDPETAYQTLEKMPFFWQDMDGPAEHMLLSFDVAFRSGVEPLHASRADFLTRSLLSSPQGFAALTRERIPIPRLVSTTRWHYDISSMPAGMVPNISTRAQALTDQIRTQSYAQAATAEGMKRSTEATQNLALDLALSRHVYAQTFSSAHIDVGSDLDDTNFLSQATRAMSLSTTEPPLVKFGFLRPVRQVLHDDEEILDDADDDVSTDIPLGVRLLLSQWEVGTNPEAYVYKDPYEDHEDARTHVPPPKRNPPDREYPQPSIPAIVSIPPLVVSSTSRPPGVAQGPPAWNAPRISSGRPAPPFPIGSAGVLRDISSQEAPYTFDTQEDIGPSTQPLPGPFGSGRRQQGSGKKKAVKKRMGGF